MAILYLTRIESIVLSTVSNTKLGMLSALKLDYMAYLADDNKYLKEFTIESLINNGLLMRKDKKLVLPIQIETPYYMMNDPDQVLMYQRMGDVNKTYFCYKEPYWIQYTQGGHQLPDCLAYPMADGMLAQWFLDDVVGRGEFVDLESDNSEIHLSIDELFVMNAIQDIYFERVKEFGQLDREHQIVTMAALSSSSMNQKDYGIFVAKLMPKEIKKQFLSDVKVLKTSIDGLLHKGMLLEEDGGYRFGILAQILFNPGRIKNGFLLNNRTKDQSSVVMGYIYDCGASVIDYSPSVVGIRFRFYNNHTPKEDLWGIYINALHEQMVTQ